MTILYEYGKRFSMLLTFLKRFFDVFRYFFDIFSIFSIGLYIGQRSGRPLFRFAAGTFGHELLEQLVLPILMQPGVQPFPRQYAVFRNFPERSFLLGKTVEVVLSFHTAIFSQLAASCMRGFVQTGQLCSWMFLVTTVALPPTTIVQIHLESVSPQGQGNSRTSVLPMNPCGLLFSGGNAAFGRFECAPQLVGNWLYCLKYFSAYCLFSERYWYPGRGVGRWASANSERVACIEAGFFKYQYILVGTRWKVLDEIYRMYILLHCSDLKVSVMIRPWL